VIGAHIFDSNSTHDPPVAAEELQRCWMCTTRSDAREPDGVPTRLNEFSKHGPQLRIVTILRDPSIDRSDLSVERFCWTRRQSV